MSKIEHLIEGRFSLNTLFNLGVSEENIKKLEDILKIPRNTRNENLFFVGLLEIDSDVYICLPKVYDIDELKKSDARDLVKTLLVISQNTAITSRVPDAHFLQQREDSSFLGRLHLAKFLIEDFLEKGDMTFRESNVVIDNRFQPNWTKTITETIPIISKAGPIYDRWFSKRQYVVADKALKNLHHLILKECIERYGDLLGYTQDLLVSLSHAFDKIPSHAESVIDARLRRSYVQRDIYVLKAMNEWISKKHSSLNFFGTRHFHIIWEEVCSFLFDNKKYDASWKDVFPRPLWNFLDTGQSMHGDKFEVDILSDILPGKLILADAKYYNISNRKFGILGVNDVAKQINYEQIIVQSDFFKESYGPADNLENIFIFPALHDASILNQFCTVEMPGLHSRKMRGLSLDSRQAFINYIENSQLSSLTVASVLT